MAIKTTSAGFDSVPELHLPRYDELPEIELYMDQVVALTQKYLSPLLREGAEKAVTSSMVNNYVKQGAIPPPAKKRYSREHLARLLIICVIKPILPIPSIQSLMQNYLNRCTVSEMYDRFCDMYERLAAQTLELARAHWQELRQREGSDEVLQDDLTVRMAITASVYRLLIEAMLGTAKPQDKGPKDAEEK